MRARDPLGSGLRNRSHFTPTRTAAGQRSGEGRIANCPANDKAASQVGPIKKYDCPSCGSASLNFPKIMHERIEPKRLVAVRAFAKQTRLVPRLGGKVQTGGLVRRQSGCGRDPSPAGSPGGSITTPLIQLRAGRGGPPRLRHHKVRIVKPMPRFHRYKHNSTITTHFRRSCCRQN